MCSVFTKGPQIFCSSRNLGALTRRSCLPDGLRYVASLSAMGDSGRLTQKNREQAATGDCRVVQVACDATLSFGHRLTPPSYRRRDLGQPADS